VKRYLAGAIDSQTGELIWVESERKNTLLFVNLLWELVPHFREAKVIHVILDNYSIHSTQQVEMSLATAEGQGDCTLSHFPNRTFARYVSSQAALSDGVEFFNV
jgi:hypothetical protein